MPKLVSNHVMRLLHLGTSTTVLEPKAKATAWVFAAAAAKGIAACSEFVVGTTAWDLNVGFTFVALPFGIGFIATIAVVAVAAFGSISNTFVTFAFAQPFCPPRVAKDSCFGISCT